jgi:hypothetical protein
MKKTKAKKKIKAKKNIKAKIKAKKSKLQFNREISDCHSSRLAKTPALRPTCLSQSFPLGTDHGRLGS